MMEAKPEAHVSSKDVFKDDNRRVKSLLDWDEDGSTCVSIGGKIVQDFDAALALANFS